MKRALCLIGGFFWLLFAVGFGLLLAQYVAQGDGLQFFGWIFSSESVLLGLVQVVGLVIAAFLCFAVGAGLMARGFVRARDEIEKTELNES